MSISDIVWLMLGGDDPTIEQDNKRIVQTLTKIDSIYQRDGRDYISGLSEEGEATELEINRRHLGTFIRGPKGRDSFFDLGTNQFDSLSKKNLRSLLDCDHYGYLSLDEENKRVVQDILSVGVSEFPGLEKRNYLRRVEILINQELDVDYLKRIEELADPLEDPDPIRKLHYTKSLDKIGFYVNYIPTKEDFETLLYINSCLEVDYPLFSCIGKRLMLKPIYHKARFDLFLTNIERLTIRLLSWMGDRFPALCNSIECPGSEVEITELSSSYFLRKTGFGLYSKKIWLPELGKKPIDVSGISDEGGEYRPTINLDSFLGSSLGVTEYQCPFYLPEIDRFMVWIPLFLMVDFSQREMVSAIKAPGSEISFDMSLSVFDAETDKYQSLKIDQRLNVLEEVDMSEISVDLRKLAIRPIQDTIDMTVERDGPVVNHLTCTNIELARKVRGNMTSSSGFKLIKTTQESHNICSIRWMGGQSTLEGLNYLTRYSSEEANELVNEFAYTIHRFFPRSAFSSPSNKTFECI
jgi:hypothetical protein